MAGEDGLGAIGIGERRVAAPFCRLGRVRTEVGAEIQSSMPFRGGEARLNGWCAFNERFGL